MSIHLYDKILLKDGRTASVVEILAPDEAFLVDIDLSGDWETIQISIGQIKAVL